MMTHEHDYRCKLVAPNVYHAVCVICGDDAGVVDTSNVTVIYGSAEIKKPTDSAHSTARGE